MPVGKEVTALAAVRLEGMTAERASTEKGQQHELKILHGEVFQIQAGQTGVDHTPVNIGKTW